MAFFQVTPISRQMIEVELDWYAGRCEQFCRFCPRSWDTDRARAAMTDTEVARAVEEFRQLIAFYEVDDVALCAGDLLEFPGIFELLDLCRAAGRKIQIATPGLRLADPDFAARFVPYAPRIDLTLLSDDPVVYERMTGRPDAPALVRTAIRNLAELGLEHRVAVVVTADNVASLADTLHALVMDHGLDEVLVRNFFPDLRKAPEGYHEQFPTYAAVLDQLRTLDARLDRSPRVQLSNFPLCQLDLSGLRRLRIFPTADFNFYKQDRLAVCGDCSEQDRCVYLPETYRRRLPFRPPDPEHVARVRATIAAQPRGGLGGSLEAMADPVEQAAPAGRRVSLLPGLDWVITDGPAEWFTTGGLGVRLEGEIPASARPLLDRLRGQMQGASKSWTIDELRHTGAWAAAQVRR